MRPLPRWCCYDSLPSIPVAFHYSAVHAQLDSASLHLASRGWRPMKKISPKAAFVQAQHSFRADFFRTALFLRDVFSNIQSDGYYDYDTLCDELVVGVDS